MLCGLQKRKHSLCSIFRLHLKNTTGADGDEATPVPIPNTEVKLISVENTWLATAWEDRAVPVQTQKGLNIQTFLAYCPLAQSVEHLTVNQGVASSSLAGAANITHSPMTVGFIYIKNPSGQWCPEGFKDTLKYYQLMAKCRQVFNPLFPYKDHTLPTSTA